MYQKIREAVSFMEINMSIAMTQTHRQMEFISIFPGSGLVKGFLNHLLKGPEGVVRNSGGKRCAVAGLPVEAGG